MTSAAAVGQVVEVLGEQARPDDVDEEDVEVGALVGEPDPVLGELVGGRGRHLDNRDTVPADLLELVEMLAQEHERITGVAGGDAQLGGADGTRHAASDGDARTTGPVIVDMLSLPARS
jgi:hypothetical protein